jgi:ATP-dependent DNA helicase RecG
MGATLASPLTELAGVGPALAKKLERLGLFRVEDLLFLLPLRYEDRTQLVKLGAVQIGQRCLVSGEVQLAETVYRGRRNLLVRIGDGTGQATLRFFHFSRQQQAQFHPGVKVTCFGEVQLITDAFDTVLRGNEDVESAFGFAAEEIQFCLDETME